MRVKLATFLVATIVLIAMLLAGFSIFYLKVVGVIFFMFGLLMLALADSFGGGKVYLVAIVLFVLGIIVMFI